VWSAGVDRNNRGHIRFLAVDPSALAPSTALTPAPDKIGKTETLATEKAEDEAELASVEGEKTKASAELAQATTEKATAPEAEKIDPLLARLEADLAAAEAKSRAVESLAYWALGSLIALLMVAVSFLLAWRKKASALGRRDYESEPKPLAVN
jgi:hypothetical protein